MLVNLTEFIRWWIVMSLLTLAPVLGPALGLSAAPVEPVAMSSEHGECIPLGAKAEAETMVRGESFDVIDQELAYAGGYGLRPVARILRGSAFDFADHELSYAGGYGLRPLLGVVPGPAFDFLDHEFVYAGGYGLRHVSGLVRGPAFDFLDHELRYAGSYGLCAAALAAR